MDAERVFASGHSWGSLMTQMLGLGMTGRLAAIAPCSGVFFGGASEKMLRLPYARENGLELPVWMHWGMEEGWLIPGVPTHENETGKTIELWLWRNPEHIPKHWEDCVCRRNGRFLDHRMEKDGAAPVWFTQVEDMPHATMPEMSFRIWEEFFAHFRRNADGSVARDG